MGAVEQSRTVRERYIPLPTVDDDYRQVLLLGTTGAGKTTVVRQLLGTDPVNDRFPSTSTAKTTVADSEIVLADGDFKAVITFFGRSEVVKHLEDCGCSAALAILHGAAEKDVRDRLLDHEQQRFRFSYILGRRTEPAANEQSVKQFDEFDEFDEFDSAGDAEGESASFDADPEYLPSIDLEETNAVIDQAIGTLRELVTAYAETIRKELDATTEDEQVVTELLDDELDRLLRTDERFQAVITSLLAEMEKRFSALSTGQIERDVHGWPENWTWESSDRTAFLRAVNRFSSNYAPLFGHLLTPLVDGIRVAGPFHPTWWQGEIPRLVLIDGEGLGHTPKSSASLSTAVANRINTVDAVLLVDNAAQPMQAAPAAAVRSILTSGNAEKLIFCFTHFDEVTGDNLASIKDRAHHVLDSVNNLLATIRDDFNSRAEQALRRRLDDNRVFLSRIDMTLQRTDTDGKWSITQFTRLLAMIEKVTDRPDLGPARPVYDKAGLEKAVVTGIEDFHRRWDAVLGLKALPGIAREHWTRIKALNRRFAEGSADEYNTLRPSSDLREFVKEEIYKQLETPTSWTGRRPDDSIILTAVIDEFSNAIAKRLSDPIHDRLSVTAQPAWQRCLAFSGAGSTVDRARYIGEEILRRHIHASDPNGFLHEVLASLDEAAKEVDITIR